MVPRYFECHIPGVAAPQSKEEIAAKGHKRRKEDGFLAAKNAARRCRNRKEKKVHHRDTEDTEKKSTKAGGRVV